MDVQETSLRTVLEGTKQYRVPLYQRTYSWDTTQMERLWTDVVRVADERKEGEQTHHFTGSLVLSLGKSGPAGTEFLVVDGQQRLTTLSILLSAIRDHVWNAQHDEMHRARINENYLVNRFERGDGRLKLLPTQADRASFLSVVDNNVATSDRSNVAKAYSFFLRKLAEADDPDDEHDIARIEEAVLEGLVFVAITARGDDNVYRIFESLNNTGRPLSQADLLRNYVFMRLGSRGDEIYNSLWLDMQDRLGSDQLQQLFWLDIVRRQPLVTQSDVYSAQQKRLEKLSDDEIVEEVRRWSRLARLVEVMVDPTNETDADVRLHLRRLRDWGTSTVEPLILELLWRRHVRTDTPEDTASALAVIESYFVRRLLIGRATAGVNKVLLAATAELRSEDKPAERLLRYLSTGRKWFGTDEEVKAAVHTVPVYFQGRPNQRKLVLRWLEESFRSKEPVDLTRTTIEHVLPQTLTPEWEQALRPFETEDESVESIHQTHLHTIGNLTLTGYNSELSNSPFEKKRDELARSGLRMNQEIATEDTWGPRQIRSRADRLAAIIAEQWPAPIPGVVQSRPGVDWSLAHQAVDSLGYGEWTTYGDLAALIGSHAVPVGQHFAWVELRNAWRVLKADGSISPQFRWNDPADARDPREVLEAEGIRFGPDGRADHRQRLDSQTLAERLGVELTSVIDELPIAPGDEERAERFMEQLRSSNSPETVHGVIALIDSWTDLGGEVDYGTGEQTSCILQIPRHLVGGRRIRPFAIYPQSSLEIGFQYLARSVPFDEMARRETLRARLNEVEGVAIEASKMTKRPNVELDLLAPVKNRVTIAEAMKGVLLAFVRVDV